MSIFLVGCADSVNIKACTVIAEDYGFFSGCWHGSIVLFSLVGSAFSHDISVYAVNNSGFGYDLGFFVFALAFLTVTIRYSFVALLVILETFRSIFS